DMLDPDLVVMDEFQRFNLLFQQTDDEQSMLARRFFNDSRSNTKILLLSATPYKPYSTLEELNTNGQDEHYQDFMKVMDFLFISKKKMEDFRLTWQQYSSELKRTDITDLTPLLEAKSKAEDTLYSVMCRTERFNSGIINDSGVTDIEVMPEDILSYAQCQNLIDCLANEQTDVRLGHLPMEYVKSSPYLLSFMDKYELKKQIVKALQLSEAAANCKTDTLLLSKYAINNYRHISPAHGKLKFLHDLTFGERNEKKTHLLLWMPASNPYYKAGGLFESEEAKSFSKIILFSSWEMVPRMISVMMSYYAERYTFGMLKKQLSELRYKSKYGEIRLRNDSLLEYPCISLAKLYSPKYY
ncbi:MAG: helicase, partial [Prevotella sp.]|nr:helicase [Prevotella sp.]